MSSTRLTTVISGADIAAVGTISVSVTTPAPGGGVSNALTFRVAPGPAPGTGVVQMISVAPDGSPSNGSSFTPPAISVTGRYVALQSDATNLVPGPASGFADIYVRDTCIGVSAGCTPSTIRVSVGPAGMLANGNSRTPSLSADGRFVAFDSSASNLVNGDTNGQSDVFVRDTCIGATPGCTPTTTRVSVASDGSEANGDSRNASISASGRFVAFNSIAANLVPGDSNGQIDVFLRDTCTGVAAGCTSSTSRVSVASDSTQGDGPSFIQSINADGRFVAFQSFAANLVAGDTNGQSDVFVRDTCFGAAAACTASTVRVSLGSDGSQANNGSGAPAMSGAGRVVAFASVATNLAAGSTNGPQQLYIRDTCAGVSSGCMPATIRASAPFDDSAANQGSADASVSSDGRFVAFDSLATNLIYGGSAGPQSVFIRDTCTGAPPGCITTTILLARRTADGLGGNGADTNPVLSADGHFAAFLSNATNLLPGGSNGNVQVFLAKTGF